MDSGITNFHKKQIEELKEKFNNFSIEYLEINLSDFKDFQTLDYISLDTYSRLLIPKLKPELKKVIYLDVDLILLDDIKKLFDVDLEGKDNIEYIRLNLSIYINKINSLIYVLSTIFFN